MREDTKYKIKKFSNQLKQALFYGAFAMVLLKNGNTGAIGVLLK